MASTSNCVICEKSFSEGETVQVKKGLINLVRVSKLREDCKHEHFKNVEEIVVHKLCRREYIKDQNIKNLLREKKSLDQTGSDKMSDDEDISIIKENLLCPICDNYMCAPIRQCKTGHSICDQCFSKIKKCPKCRGPKSEARCYTLEAIAARLTLSCRYKHTGCYYTARGEALWEHEKFCRYGPMCCPFRTYDNCSWIGHSAKLKSHCMKKHRNNFYSREKQKFLAKNFIEIKSYHYIYVLIHAYNEYFRLTWELDDNTGITKWSILFMGTKENSKKFSYKIEFPKEPLREYADVSRSITWKSPCGILPENDGEKFVGHNYLMVHRDHLNTYCEANGDLNYTAHIYKTVYCDEESGPEDDEASDKCEDDIFESIEDANDTSSTE